MDVIIASYYSTSPSVIVENAPLNFVRGGLYGYDNGRLFGIGTDGRYSSATAYNSGHILYLYFFSQGFNPQHYDSKGYGFSVCCATEQSHHLLQPAQV